MIKSNNNKAYLLLYMYMCMYNVHVHVHCTCTLHPGDITLECHCMIVTVATYTVQLETFTRKRFAMRQNICGQNFYPVFWNHALEK